MRGTPKESADSKDNKRRNSTTNHYAVMGIQDFARGSEAKRAYHRLALKWHPDRQVHAPEDHQKEAEDVFKASSRNCNYVDCSSLALESFEYSCGSICRLDYK